MDTFKNLSSQNKHQYGDTKLKELVLIHIESFLIYTLYAHFQVSHNQEVDQ